MPENMLTIGDVYKPISAVEYMQFQQAAMQNKIAQMQMDEYQRDIGFSQSVANALMQPPAAPTPTAPRVPIARATPTAMPGGALMPGVGTPSGGIQPGVTPPAPAIQPPPAPAMQEQLAPLMKMAQDMGIPPEAVKRDPPGFYRWVQAQQAKNVEQVKALGGFIKEVSLPAFMRMWRDGVFENTSFAPLLNKINPDDLSMANEGKSIVNNIPGVGSVIVTTDSEGKEHFHFAPIQKQTSTLAGLQFAAQNGTPEEKVKATKTLSAMGDYQASLAYRNALARNKALEEAQTIKPLAALKAGQYWYMTGRFPPGMGLGWSIRKQVMDAGSDWAEKNGLKDNWYLATREMQTRATQANMIKIETMKGMTENFEATVLAYIPVLQEQSTKVHRVPIKSIAGLEMWYQMGLKGDPDTQAFYGTLYELLVDYSKVVTGNFSMSGLTDTARQEGARLLSVQDKPETFNAVLANFQVLMMKRVEALKSTQDSVINRYLGQGLQRTGGLMTPPAPPMPQPFVGGGPGFEPGTGEGEGQAPSGEGGITYRNFDAEGNEY